MDHRPPQLTTRLVLPRRLRDDGWWLVHAAWRPAGAVVPFPASRDRLADDRRSGEHHRPDRTSEAGHVRRS